MNKQTNSMISRLDLLPYRLLRRLRLKPDASPAERKTVIRIRTRGENKHANKPSLHVLNANNPSRNISNLHHQQPSLCPRHFCYSCKPPSSCRAIALCRATSILAIHAFCCPSRYRRTLSNPGRNSNLASRSKASHPSSNSSLTRAVRSSAAPCGLCSHPAAPQ